MLRMAALLAAATALTPLTTANAIKVTLSGEIDLGVNYPNLTSYTPTPNASGDLDFDIVHQVGDGNTVGGNLDLDAAFDFDGTVEDLTLGKADIYVDGAFGRVTLTTDGELDNAGSFNAVAEEVTGESGDLSIVYETPTIEGFDAAVAFDLIQGDSSATIGYKNNIVEIDVDLEQVANNFFTDGEIEVTYGDFTGNLYGAVGMNTSDAEFEGAIRGAYDFGTASIYAGVTSYLELEAGVSFEVQNLTLNFDVAGMAPSTTPSTNTILTPTSMLPDTLDITLGAEYVYADHLTLEAEVSTSTVASVNTSTASLGATLSF